MATKTAYVCTSQLWDADGSVPYDSVDDFLTMCEAIWGEAPDLQLDSDGVCLHDSSTGECILAPVAA